MNYPQSSNGIRGTGCCAFFRMIEELSGDKNRRRSDIWLWFFFRPLLKLSATRQQPFISSLINYRCRSRANRGWTSDRDACVWVEPCWIDGGGCHSGGSPASRQTAAAYTLALYPLYPLVPSYPLAHRQQAEPGTINHPTTPAIYSADTLHPRTHSNITIYTLG